MTRFRRQLHSATRSASASSRPPSGARDSSIASRCLCQPCSDSKCATTGRRLRITCLVALRLTLSLPWCVFGPVLLFLSRATSFLPSAIRVPSSPRFERDGPTLQPAPHTLDPALLRQLGRSSHIPNPTVTLVRNGPLNTACRTLIEESSGCEDDQAALQAAENRSCLAQVMRSGTVGLSSVCRTHGASWRSCTARSAWLRPAASHGRSLQRKR